MPKLTTAAVAKYTAGARRREIRDGGAPGLYLIIQPPPRGTKSWALRFRRPDGKPAKMTLGLVDLTDKETADEPTLGGALTLRAARELANRIDRERARGVDVVEARKADKSRARTAAAERAANSFGAAVREFFADHKTKLGSRPRRWRGDARLLGLDWPRDADPAKVEPAVIAGSLAATWADRPASGIDAHDVYVVVDDARRNGIPGLQRHNIGVSDARGRKMHAALSVLFKYLLRHRRVASNPTLGVWHPGAPPSRDRVLNDGELKAFWSATEQLRFPYGAAARLLLLTGARLNEVMGMRRGELGQDEVWTIPGARTKNHRPHSLTLPPFAREIITAVPVIEGTDLVFTISGRPATGWSRAKAELDAAMRAAGAKDLAPWRLHDLRRTEATGMADLGILPHVIEAVLNHVSGAKAGVAGIYNRSTYAAEKAAALQRWAAHIEGLVSGRPAKVLPIRGAR
jgi:integrase